MISKASESKLIRRIIDFIGIALGAVIAAFAIEEFLVQGVPPARGQRGTHKGGLRPPLSLPPLKIPLLKLPAVSAG